MRPSLLHYGPERVDKIVADTALDLRSMYNDIDNAIMMTPTGDRRNALTEVGIHVLAAIEALKKASI
jgi:hypothetical protein